ncbi:hypothetical protein RDABS01_019945 [Bienertia sinuspersici]
MFKHSPNRSQRSKGLKVKHVLQICVLLAVCIWLIYQVKHSHEKRREYETKDVKVIGKVQSNNEILRFGRKDISRITEIITDGEKHEEDEEEKEGEEEENKHEDDELEREDARLVDTEEERGVGDDEIDEHEPEKTETEAEQEEEVDEDKEGEGKEDTTEENHTESEEGHAEGEENEDAGKEGHVESEENEDADKEDHGEREVDSDDQEHAAERTNSREAQEVLYQADDASSEVAQQSISETGNVTVGRSNQIWGKVNFGLEHETKISDNAEDLTKSEVQPREDVKNGASNAKILNSSNLRSTRATVVPDELIKSKVNLTKPDNAEELINLSSLQNSTLPDVTSNLSIAGGEQSATLISNGTEMTHDSNSSQNGTVELRGNEEPTLPGNTTVKLQEAAADANKAENGEKAGSENQHDPIDVSDTGTLPHEETESSTDMDTPKKSELRFGRQKTLWLNEYSDDFV